MPPKLAKPPSPVIHKPMLAAPLKATPSKPHPPKPARPLERGVVRVSVAGRLGAFALRKSAPPKGNKR